MLGKCLLGLILNIGFLLCSAYGLNFKQVSYISLGMTWGVGYIKGYDFNHDGYQDLAFSRDAPARLMYYGYRPYNSYVFEDSGGPSSDIFWDVGDLDGDSLVDVLTQGDSYPTSIRIFEPNDYWTFPKNMVWSWQFEWIGNGVQHMYITDLDQDGLKEILTGDHQVIYVFENRGDNQYQKVFCDSIFNADPVGSFAFGDYDRDGRMEFVVSTYGGSDTTVFVYKCTGNDQYQKVWGGYLEAWNMYDCITLPDMNGNGEPEFLIGDVHNGVLGVTIGLWIFEATGINQYALVYSDSVTGLNDRGGFSFHSDCGDVDRDGKSELIWTIDRTWMVYKYDSLANRFQRVYTAYGGDNRHNATNVNIHDMNGNGYPEIIESGGNETHIWEVEAAQVVYPNGGETLYWDSSCAIRFRNVAPFVADSFSLFYSTDSSRTYSLIAHGIPGSDSSYVWTVPDTASDTCFIMVWAYQNATGWDFSDGPFTIRPAVGVEVFPPHASRLTPYVPCPNPFVSYATVPGHEKESFTLYDVSGRKVGIYKGDRIGWDVSPGIYFLRPDTRNPQPDPRILRIVKLR